MSLATITDQQLLTDELNRHVALFQNQILNQPNPRIQLVDFVNNWLPLILSKVDRDQQKGGGPPILHWIDEVAKSAFQAVDVYNGDVFCYKVPPILNTDAAVIPPHGGMFEAIMQMRALLDSGHTKEAHEFAERALNSKVSRDPHADTFAREMNAIAKFHGLPPMSRTVDEVSKEKESESAIVAVQKSDF